MIVEHDDNNDSDSNVCIHHERHVHIHPFSVLFFPPWLKGAGTEPWRTTVGVPGQRKRARSDGGVQSHEGSPRFHPFYLGTFHSYFGMFHFYFLGFSIFGIF